MSGPLQVGVAGNSALDGATVTQAGWLELADVRPPYGCTAVNRFGTDTGQLTGECVLHSTAHGIVWGTCCPDSTLSTLLPYSLSRRSDEMAE